MSRRRKKSASGGGASRPARRVAGEAEDIERSWLREATLWLIAAKMLGLILVIDPSALQPFEVPRVAFSRATAWLLAGLLAATLLRYGLVVIPRSRIHLLVAAVLASWVVAWVLAENSYISLHGESASYLGLSFLADVLILYLAVAVAVRSTRDWAILGAALGIGATVSIGYGLIQRVGLDPVRWDVDPQARPFSTFGNSNVFGHFLSVVLAIGLGLAAFAPRDWPRWLRPAGGLAAGAALLLIATSGTRAGLVALVAVLAAGASLYFLRHGGQLIRRPIVVLGSLAVLAAIGSTLALTPIGDRARATLAGEGLQDRLLIYDSALRAAADRPIFGFGPDAFAVAYPRYRQAGSAEVLSLTEEVSAHSWVLQAAVTTGMIGLAALVIMVLGVSAVLLRRSLAGDGLAATLLLAFVAYWAHGLVSVGAPSIDWIPWMVVAFASITARAATPDRTTRLPGWLIALPLVLAVGAALTAYQPLAASQQARLAKAHWTDGASSPAVEAARRAVQLDSGRADHWNWLGLALTQAEDWGDAGDAFAEAAERSPHRVTYWMNLAKARMLQTLNGDSRAGGAAAALEAASRAVDTDPNDPEAHFVRAQVADAFDDPDTALRESLRAIELAPGNTEYDALAMRAALRASDPAAARASLERLVSIRDSARLRVTLAELSIRLREQAVALRHVRRALELEPGDPDALRLLEQLDE